MITFVGIGGAHLLGMARRKFAGPTPTRLVLPRPELPLSRLASAPLHSLSTPSKWTESARWQKHLKKTKEVNAGAQNTVVNDCFEKQNQTPDAPTTNIKLTKAISSLQTSPGMESMVVSTSFESNAKFSPAPEMEIVVSDLMYK
jgi:hypothetical protein